MQLRYETFDVFTQAPLEGNMLAVFPDARGLDTSIMQKIAAELNLAETTFVFPSTREDCVANVRIFTPAMEMEFAGHPTVGTAFALWRAGYPGTQSGAFAFEERVGRVPVRLESDSQMFWLTTPPIRVVREVSHADAARAVGLDDSALLPGVPCQLLTAGNPNIYIALASKEDVDRAWVDSTSRLHVMPREEPTCVFVFTPTPQGAYSRMFAPEHGVVEDPATGSATGPLAKFMMMHGLAPKHDGARFVSEQGTKMGRRSFLHVLVHGEDGSQGIEVGGNVVPIATAEMTI